MDSLSQFKNPSLPPFYDGELVVATHPATLKQGCKFKYGELYRVRCEWKEWYNEHHNCWVRMWYVGVIGHEDGGCFYAPYLFSSLITGFEEISFVKIKEQEGALSAN